MDTYLEYNSAEVSHLVVRCQTGDRGAFDEFVARYQRYVYNLIYQHLGRTDDIDDVAQEVFLRIYRFIRKYRGNSSMESWIYKVVLNYCRTHARRRAMHNRFFAMLMPADSERTFEFDTPAPDVFDPARGVEQRRQAQDILTAVRSLPSIYSDILIMREVSELSYEEISQILGISVGTVKSRISRARELVRSKVKL